jgi:transposase InsO family protein
LSITDGLVPTPDEEHIELIFHSDRGSQYASHEFRAALEQYGIRASMSRKGNCWDNATTSHFSTSTPFTNRHPISANPEYFSAIEGAKQPTTEECEQSNC